MQSSRPAELLMIQQSETQQDTKLTQKNQQSLYISTISIPKKKKSRKQSHSRALKLTHNITLKIYQSCYKFHQRSKSFTMKTLRYLKKEKKYQQMARPPIIIDRYEIFLQRSLVCILFSFQRQPAPGHKAPFFHLQHQHCWTTGFVSCFSVLSCLFTLILRISRFFVCFWSQIQALCVLGKHSNTELHSQSLLL